MNGKIYLITHAEDEGPGLLEGFFSRLGWEEITLCLWRGDELPPDPGSAAGVVMLGGPMNVYQEKAYPFLKKEDQFVRAVLGKEIPFLGICLGAQLLAKACGAAVTRAAYKEIGWSTVDLTAWGLHDPLFHGLGPTLSVLQWHEDTFALPDGGVLLATGERCRNQAFRVGGRAYGLQFHLEVTTDMAKKWSEGTLSALEADRIDKEGASLRTLGEGQARTLGANFQEIIESAVSGGGGVRRLGPAAGYPLSNARQKRRQKLLTRA